MTMSAAFFEPRAARLVTCALIAAVLSGCGPANEQEVIASAEARAAKGDHDGAVIELKSLLQAEPDAKGGRFMLGRMLLAQGDAAGAQAEFERALRAGHDEGATLPVLARALLVQRKPAEVVKLATNAKLQNPRAAAELATVLAQALQSQGQDQPAAKVVADALERSPDHPDLLVMQVRLSAAAGADRSAGISRAAELAQRFPAHAEVQLLQGDALTVAGDKAAASSYEKVLALDPRSGTAYAALIQGALRDADLARAKALVNRLSKALPGLGQTVYFEALVAYLDGDLERARERSQLLLRPGGENPRTLMLAGLIEKRLGATERAYALLSQALAGQPDRVELRRELASVSVLQGKAENALHVIKPVLTPANADAASWAVAGQAYTQLGDYKQADMAFSRAKSLGPDNAATRVAYARSLLVRGQHDQGVNELRQAAQAPAAGPEATLELVATLMKRGDNAGALNAVNQLAQRNPRAAMPLLLKGRVLESSRDLDGARNAYAAALLIDANLTAALDRLAQLDVAEGKAAAARDRYKLLLKRNPKSTAAMLAMADLTRQEGGKVAAMQKWLDEAVAVNPADPEPWLAAIAQERRLGDDSQVLARARRAASALPENTEILVQLANILMATGDFNQGLMNLQKVAALNPRSAEARLQLAHAQVAAGNLPAARKSVDRALEIDGLAFATERAHVVLLMKEGQAERALQVVEKRKNRLPNDLDTLLLDAELHSFRGQSARAIQALRSALALESRSDIAFRLSSELRRSSDAGGADSFDHGWLRKHPKDVEYMAQLAQQLAAQGNRARAEALYRQVIAIAPEASLALNNLANLLLQGNPAEALVLAERAVQLAPGAAPLLDTLAQALLATGAVDRAIRVQALAVDRDPRSSALRLSLAKMYTKAGETDKARKQLQLVADRDNANSAEALRLLQELSRS